MIAGEKRALESTQKPEAIQNDLKHEGANLVLPSPKRKSPERTTEKKSPKQKKVAKKIMSSDSGSLTPTMPKRKAENSKEKETSKKNTKPKEENLVKRKPQKKAERYESDDEDSGEAARKPKRQKATHASKPTTKKLNLDDSDLELMQKNQRILAKEDKKKRKPKAKAIASDESSVLSEESDASEPSDASDSEY